MRTTDGPSALATFENARDSARASLGASVFGVTAAPAAAAGRDARGGRAGVAVEEAGQADAAGDAERERGERSHACDCES